MNNKLIFLLVQIFFMYLLNNSTIHNLRGKVYAETTGKYLTTEVEQAKAKKAAKDISKKPSAVERSKSDTDRDSSIKKSNENKSKSENKKNNKDKDKSQKSYDKSETNASQEESVKNYVSNQNENSENSSDSFAFIKTNTEANELLKDGKILLYTGILFIVISVVGLFMTLRPKKRRFKRKRRLRFK